MFFIGPGVDNSILNTSFFVDPPAYTAPAQTTQPLSAIELSVREILSQATSGKSSPSLTTRELVAALAEAPAATRQKCILRLLELSRSNKEAGEFIQDKLDNAVSYCSVEERVLILSSLLATSTKQLDSQCALILKASHDLSTLRQVIAGCDQQKLKKAGESTQNIMAQAELYHELRMQKFTGLGCSEMVNKLQELMKSCREDQRWKGSEVAADTLRVLKATHDEILKLKNVSPEVAAKYALICELQMRYGVRITTGESDLLDVFKGDNHGIDIIFFWGQAQRGLQELGSVAWTMSDIEEIADVLHQIPEGALIFSPRLCDIELVPSLGLGVLGARYSADGKIKIASWTRNNAEFAKEYDGVSALKIVLAHEIGHGLQIGEGDSGIHNHGEHGPGFGAGEARFDFDEYIQIAGWEVIPRERYKAGDERGTIILDGNKIPLEVPVTIDGKPYVFTHFTAQNILICYRADGEFSQRWYAKASPWEDFAEAFAEYIFLPERLIKNAPHKFLHLDEEFRKYR